MKSMYKDLYIIILSKEISYSLPTYSIRQKEPFAYNNFLLTVFAKVIQNASCRVNYRFKLLEENSSTVYVHNNIVL